VARRIKSMKNLYDLNGNRTCDLASSTVPQPTVPPHHHIHHREKSDWMKMQVGVGILEADNEYCTVQCYGSGSWLMAFHDKGLSSISGQSF